MHKTIFDNEFKIEDCDLNFDYQKELSLKLDNAKSDFDQSLINEIVLWKVNRYAKIDDETLKLINTIDTNSSELNLELATQVLKKLIKIKGIKLPMASTILRFKNKKVFQIIDQRVYRIIYQGKTLKLSQSTSEKNIDLAVELYFQYLVDLKNACEKLKIPFENSDRILYNADKRINKTEKIKNYS